MSSRARKSPTPGRKTAARKKSTRKTAVARKTPAPSRSRGVPPAADRKRADQLTLEERTRTENWFSDTQSEMTADETILDMEILLAPSGSMKDELNRMKGKLLRSRAELDRREEAFFAQGSTETLMPPSPADIIETKRLAKELGEQIAKQKTAEAVLKLLDDFAGLVARISA
jgi:hypothetical protein